RTRFAREFPRRSRSCGFSAQALRCEVEDAAMGKWQQKFSIGYFFVALALLFLLQNYLASTPAESISYSQFKALVAKGEVADLSVAEKTLHGEIKPEAAKSVPALEKANVNPVPLKEDKKGIPVVTMPVEHSALVAGLERAGINF